MAPPAEPDVFGLLLGLQRAGIVDLLAVEKSLERRTAVTRWLMQEARSFPCTERWNFAGLTEWTQTRLELMPFAYATDTVAEFLAHFGSPATVVSSRYHGAVVAAWHGCRVGLIARSAKFDGLVDELDVPFVRAIARPEDLDALAADAAPVAPARLIALRDRAVAMCDDFFAWLREN